MPDRFLSSFAPPRVVIPSQATVKYGVSPLFDFDTGDFKLDSAGRIVMADRDQAWAQWCEKAVLIERFEFVIYPDNYGIELHTIEEGNVLDAQIQAQQYIKEALVEDDRILDVVDFSFEQAERGSYRVSFRVVPYTGSTETMEVLV